MKDIYGLAFFWCGMAIVFDAYSRLLIAVFDFHFGGIGISSE